MLRGGSWNNNQHNARCAYRNRNNNRNNNNVGCRVVVSHIFLPLPAISRVGAHTWCDVSECVVEA